MDTPFNIIQALSSWFFRRDADISLPSGRKIVVTGANVEISSGGIVITGGNITIDGTVDGVDISAHVVDGGAHHTWPLVEGDIPAAIARDSEVASEIATHRAIPGAHHTRLHPFDSASDHSGNLAWANVNKTGSDLADLVTRAHNSVTGVTTDQHHAKTHTILSHDTTGTGAELTTLTDGSNADSLHDHVVATHTILSHDTTGTGAELTTLTDGSDAGSLHIHDARYFQESEFSSAPGSTSKPLKSSSGGVLTLTHILTTADARIGDGLVVGSNSLGAASGNIMMGESSTPGTPPSGFGILWLNVSGSLHFINDAGTDTAIT